MVKAAICQSETKHLPADGKDHFYFYFMLQLLFVNMIPHNVVKSYFNKNMDGWCFRRVKTFDTNIFICHAVFVFFTWVLGLTVYSVGAMAKAVPDSNIFY